MLPKRKIIEVFEELSPQDNGYWAVPDGVYEVEFALVAGGLNGESSDIYNAGIESHHCPRTPVKAFVPPGPVVTLVTQSFPLER